METQKVITNPDRSRFYCWGWDWFFPIRKLGQKCFRSQCQKMYVPALAHYRMAERCADYE